MFRSHPDNRLREAVNRYRERRDTDLDGIPALILLDRTAQLDSRIGHACPAEFLRIACKNLLVLAGIRNTDHEILIGDIGKVGHNQERFLRLHALAQIDEHIALPVQIADPLKALRILIQLIERRLAVVQFQKRSGEGSHLSALRRICFLPADPACCRLRRSLCEILSHRDQFLARMSHQIGIRQAEIGHLQLGLCTRHLADQRLASVAQKIMRQSQDKFFAVHVHGAERQIILMRPAEKRIQLDIVHIVMNAAVVPLVIEAESSAGYTAGHLRESRLLFCSRDDTRKFPVNRLIQIFQKSNGLEILIAAVHVRDPLPGFAAVVQIHHRCDVVDAQAVRVICRQPEHGTRDEETADLTPAVIEDQASAERMHALLRIQMLIETGPVERGKSLVSSREAARHPVKDDADARRMHGLHEREEVLRRSAASRRCEKSAGGISHALIVRILHHRHELYVGIAHGFHIIGHLRRDLRVGIR